jgi:hypothetical protein
MTWSDELPDQPPYLDGTMGRPVPVAAGPSCPHCAHPIGFDQGFCSHCGLSVTTAAATALLPPPPAAAPGLGPTVGAPATAARRYQVLTPLGNATRVLLAICGVVAAGSLVADVAQYVFVDDFLSDPGGFDAVDRLEMSDLWQALVGFLIFIALVPTAIVFLLWLFRASENLPSLGTRNPSYTPAWAVGWWFVPFANLVFPKLVVDEVWQRSDTDAPPDHSGGVHRPKIPISQHLWWGCLVTMVTFWLLAFVLGAGDIIDPDRERLVAALQIGSSAAALAAAVLGYGLVTDITYRQTERAAALGADRPAPDPRFAVVQTVVDQPQVDGYPPPPATPPTTVAGQGWPLPGSWSHRPPPPRATL